MISTLVNPKWFLLPAHHRSILNFVQRMYLFWKKMPWDIVHSEVKKGIAEMKTSLAHATNYFGFHIFFSSVSGQWNIVIWWRMWKTGVVMTKAKKTSYIQWVHLQTRERNNMWSIFIVCGKNEKAIDHVTFITRKDVRGLKKIFFGMFKQYSDS